MARLYVPLCVDYYTDAKVLAAGEAAEVLYVRALGLAKTLPSDGYLTDGQVRLLGLPDVESRATSLVSQQLWMRKDGGWQITAWLRHNLPASEVEAWKERKRAAGRAGGQKSAEARRQAGATAGATAGGEPRGQRHLKQPGEAKVKRSGSGSGSGRQQVDSNESTPPADGQQGADEEQDHLHGPSADDPEPPNGQHRREPYLEDCQLEWRRWMGNGEAKVPSRAFWNRLKGQHGEGLVHELMHALGTRAEGGCAPAPDDPVAYLVATLDAEARRRAAGQGPGEATYTPDFRWKDNLRGH